MTLDQTTSPATEESLVDKMLEVIDGDDNEAAGSKQQAAIDGEDISGEATVPDPVAVDELTVETTPSVTASETTVLVEPVEQVVVAAAEMVAEGGPVAAEEDEDETAPVAVEAIEVALPVIAALVVVKDEAAAAESVPEHAATATIPVTDAVVDAAPEPKPPVVVAQELPHGFLDTVGRVHQESGPHYRGRILKVEISENLEETVASLQATYEELKTEAESLFAEAEAAANKSSILGKVRRMKATAGSAEALGDFDSLFDRLRHTEAAALEQIRQRKEAKEALIARSEALVDSTHWKATSDAFREIFDEWRQIGSVGRAADESLWKRFQNARDTFSKHRSEYFAGRQVEWSANKELKEAVIVRAAEFGESTEWRATTEALRNMMTEWKAIGSAGREHDDDLWNRFRAAQQLFFDRRNAIGDEARLKKEALIARAHEITESGDFDRGGDAMRDLMDEWRTVGPAGRRDVDDSLWAQFRAAQEPFFAQRSAARSPRQQEAVQPVNDRKQAIAEEAEALLYAGDPVAASEQIDALEREFDAIGPTRPDRDATLSRRFRKAADEIMVAAAAEGARRAVSWEGKIREALRRTRDEVVALQAATIRDEELLANLKAELKNAKGEASDLLKSQVGETEERLAGSQAEVQRLQTTMTEIEASLRGED